MRCKKPDRDVSQLTCGYPRPCPHHDPIAPCDATIDTTDKTITTHTARGERHRSKLADIAGIIDTTQDGEGEG